MMSSRERTGYSDSRSSTVSPLASMRTIWWTGIRVPFTHAWPWQMFGLIEIRSNCTAASSLSSLLLDAVFDTVELWIGLAAFQSATAWARTSSAVNRARVRIRRSAPGLEHGRLASEPDNRKDRCRAGIRSQEVLLTGLFA